MTDQADRHYVTGLDEWSTELLERFVSDLERAADSSRSFRTLDAARTELASRAVRPAGDP
ncbi:hypothetical protein [Rhodococcus sp. T7]|uniref:hypothetical protein n=1 Tax=Rhodococcus sp. T7 TaxID=627444 RepID=UPI001358CF28|nr:hypothetical protein [Rhodococcus sp. T7]KAF0957311.1 hypothetical protein MLGJGCBP_09141 [Rhodococcus sp. T7]KAF0959196.1 hypothetical protein MLGJGCBP_07709 [Rhodococcus sp. T7]